MLVPKATESALNINTLSIETSAAKAIESALDIKVLRCDTNTYASDVGDSRVSNALVNLLGSHEVQNAPKTRHESSYQP
jgi:electron transfer flavoprotein alpha/beta subunit